jgi:hypothetical protein
MGNRADSCRKKGWRWWYYPAVCDRRRHGQAGLVLRPSRRGDRTRVTSLWGSVRHSTRKRMPAKDAEANSPATSSRSRSGSLVFWSCRSWGVLKLDGPYVRDRERASFPSPQTGQRFGGTPPRECPQRQAKGRPPIRVPPPTRSLCFRHIVAARRRCPCPRSGFSEAKSSRSSPSRARITAWA